MRTRRVSPRPNLVSTSIAPHTKSAHALLRFKEFAVDLGHRTPEDVGVDDIARYRDEAVDLLARSKGMDVVGVLSVAFIVAFGGGTLRDVLLVVRNGPLCPAEAPSMNSDEQATRIATFWSWFVKHENDLAQIASDTDPLLDVLLQRLQEIHPKLYCEICTNSHPHQLVVTAEGRREVFPLVETIVAGAPRIESWAFVALKPPDMGFGFHTTYEGISFYPRSMWFLPLESPSNPMALGLRVGIPDFDRVQEQIAKNATLIILDTALGERSAASDIQHVEISALPSTPESQGYMELTDLPDYIEWRKRKLGD